MLAPKLSITTLATLALTGLAVQLHRLENTPLKTAQLCQRSLERPRILDHLERLAVVNRRQRTKTDVNTGPQPSPQTACAAPVHTTRRMPTTPHRRPSDSPRHNPQCVSGKWLSLCFSCCRQRSLRTPPGRTLPVEPSTKRSHHLGYVSHQIVLELAIFHHQNASPSASQRSFHILEAEPAQPLAMLNHDRAHRMVRHQTPQTATVAIQTGTDLLYDFVGSVALLRCPFDDPPDLPVQSLPRT